MPKHFEKASSDVHERVAALMQEYHPELYNLDVKIDLIFVNNPDGPPLMHQGYPALAVVRILNLKDRTKGMGDAEIVIDEESYIEMDDDRRDALLDHELHHLVPAKDKNGDPKRDDLSRPVLKMRKHDHQFGWFLEIAARHKNASIEVAQAKRMFDNYGQFYWPSITGTPTLEAKHVPIKEVTGNPAEGTVTITARSGGRKKSVTLQPGDLQKLSKKVRADVLKRSKEEGGEQ